MKVDTEKEQVYFEEYDPVSLSKISDTQHKVIDFQKKNKQKDLFSILIVVDDFADDSKFVGYLIYGTVYSLGVDAVQSLGFYQLKNTMF